MKYYTLEEVAEVIKTTRGKVLDHITGEERDKDGGMPGDMPPLFPTIYFSKPVQVRRRIDGPEWVDESVTGYFEVDGLYDTERDFYGYWRLSFGGKSRVMLSRDWSQYLLVQEKRVHESDLLVSAEELKHWMEMCGIGEELPPQTKQWGGKRKKPLKLIVEQEAKQLRDRNGGKWPNYTDLLRHLSKLANSDDSIGLIIAGVDYSSREVKLSEGDPLKFKTIQNWLTAIK